MKISDFNKRKYFSLVICLLAVLLASCAMLPVPTRSNHVGETGTLGSCADFFATLDEETEQAGVLDPGVFRVKNYPYLRVNRFIASFRGEVDNQAAFQVWTDRMQALDQNARRYEIANLPDSTIAMLDRLNGIPSASPSTRQSSGKRFSGCMPRSGKLSSRATTIESEHRFGPTRGFSMSIRASR